MNRIFAVLMGILFLLSACQKEESFELGQPAQGSLQSDLGTCLPKNVNGSYVVNQSLTDSNYIDVTLNIIQTGYYSIVTDSVNGYFFRAEGNFINPGINTVRLRGSGKPIQDGDNVFTVFFDTSFCSVQITVIPAGSSGGTATYTMDGAGSDCTGFTVAGDYNAGTALSTTNTVSLNVNVTTPGTWAISTPAVGGFSFSGAGTFTTPGIQTIQLTGSGTPTAAGTQMFMITAGATSCSFPVTVIGGTTPPPSGDHFILTDNSWWSYNTPAPNDTLKRTIVGSGLLNGVEYKLLKELNLTGAFDDTLFIRKSGNNYYELNYVDQYTSFYLDGTIVDSLLFLREGLTTGETWNSNEYSDAVNNVPTKIRYKFTCTNANATVSLNGKTYTNVYQVTMTPQVNTNNAGYVDDSWVWVNYYAQGIGWIYQKLTVSTGGGFELPVKNYMVF